MRPNNGGKKDCAMMWFTADFRGSLKVQSMGWAEQGMYRHLLDLAWENEGLPSDLDEIRGILKLSPQEFAAAWKKIGKCFEPHPQDPARLVNARQEREREIRQDVRRKRAEAGSNGQAVRQQNDGKRAASAQQTSSKPLPFADHPDSKPPAKSQQTHSLSQSRSHPSDPAGPDRESVPSCSSEKEQDDGVPVSRPAGPEGPEGESNRMALWMALRASPYRANAKHRDRDCVQAARVLDRAGITPDDLARLMILAKVRGDNPVGLWSHWIDHPDEALKELSKRSFGPALPAPSALDAVLEHAKAGS